MEVNQKVRRFIGWGVAGAWLVARPWLAMAGEAVTLTWNESPDNGVQYRLYVGGASRVYTNHIDTGTGVAATVTNLVRGGTYYFAATCYDGEGNESDYSNEVSYRATSSAPPAPTLRLGEVRVEVPVTIWSATNLAQPQWRTVGGSSAWLVLPATNAVEFFYATPAAEPWRRIGLGITGGR